MLKIIKKIFTDPDNIDKIQESTVDISVDIPIKTKKELFDEAVKAQVKEVLTRQLIRELEEMCYTPSERSDTKKAYEEYTKWCDLNQGTAESARKKFRELRESFPDALMEVVDWSHVSCISFHQKFDLIRFVDRLLEDV